MAAERTRPLRVCLVAPLPPPYGGVANWTLLLTAHAEEEDRVAFDVIDTAPRRRSADGRGLGDRILRQGFGMLRATWRLRREILTASPDVVHVTTAGQLGLLRDLLQLSLARRHAVPTVIHLRFGRVPDIARRGTREWALLRLVLARASLVMALDRETAATVSHHLPAARVALIPNPVDLAALPEPAPGDGRTVVYLGWVTPSKGMADLMDAWREVGPRHPGWRLRVIGPSETGFRAVLEARAGTATVEFTGELPHPAALAALNDAELLVLPSHSEGCPNVVLEAMALGRAVVATRVGAIPDLLDGGCGVVVEPHDPAGLAAALDGALRDPAARRAMGSAARRRVEAGLALEPVFERYVSEWGALADGRRTWALSH